MNHSLCARIVGICTVALTLSACGGASPTSAPGGPQTDVGIAREISRDSGRVVEEGEIGETTTIWDAFRRGDTEANVGVNKYIWSASLEVLNFLPVESVDPFTGVIITGFGKPPGGGREYRATVLIRDAALDARSLNVSMNTRGGPADAATVRAVEDAILTRARQLRIADEKL